MAVQIEGITWEVSAFPEFLGRERVHAFSQAFNRMAWNKSKLFSYWEPESKIKVLAGSQSLWLLQGRTLSLPLPAPGSCRQPPSHIYPHLHRPFPCVLLCPDFPLPERTLVHQIQYDLTSTYLNTSAIWKWGHSLRFRMSMYVCFVFVLWGEGRV